MNTWILRYLTILATASMLAILPVSASAFNSDNTGAILNDGDGDNHINTLNFGGDATSGAGGISAANQQTLSISILNAGNNNAIPSNDPTISSALINGNGGVGGLPQGDGNVNSSQLAQVGGNTTLGAAYTIGNFVQSTTNNIITGNNNTLGGSSAGGEN